MDFEALVKQYPKTYEKFIHYFNTTMIEPPSSVDTLREFMYSFIKKMGFVVHIDYVTLSSQGRVMMELYSIGNLISVYELLDNQNNIYYRIFKDAFEYMEEWYQEVEKQMLEKESNENVLLEL